MADAVRLDETQPIIARFQNSAVRNTDAADVTADRKMLDLLRSAARAAQCGAAGPSCSLIAPSAEVAAQVYAVALMRALDRDSLRPLIFHPRRAVAISFSEAWALRLVAALQRNDYASAAFLVGRAIAPPRRRAVQWLAQRLAQAIQPERHEKIDLA